MKLAFALLLSMMLQLCFAQNTIVIGSEYDGSFKKPIVAQQGVNYRFETDSIFFVNNQRMIMYETVINRYLNDSVDKVSRGMAQFFDQSLRRLSIEYDRLHRNADETQRTGQLFLDSTRRVLSRSIVALDTASVRLDNAQKNLDFAISEIKASRRRNWIIAIAAVAAGIGIDRLFIK